MLNKKQEAGDKPTSCGTHERIRTSGPTLRRRVLYPAELRGRMKMSVITRYHSLSLTMKLKKCCIHAALRLLLFA